MKLRNKKTGEIKNFAIVKKEGNLRSGVDGRPLNNEYYASLAELNEEWGDMPEEPKEHYEILSMGAVMEREDAEDEIFRNQGQKEIGNYFDTREEAEKAVEKLKAYKRLKDKGFRFVKVSQGIAGGEIRYKINEESEEVTYLLSLLFGGEE